MPPLSATSVVAPLSCRQPSAFLLKVALGPPQCADDGFALGQLSADYDEEIPV